MYLAVATYLVETSKVSCDMRYFYAMIVLFFSTLRSISLIKLTEYTISSALLILAMIYKISVA